MSLDPVTLLLAIPAVAALLIARAAGQQSQRHAQCRRLFPDLCRRLVVAVDRAAGSRRLLLVDEFSTIFVVLINFVSFTTSVFSATYVAHEVETGGVTPDLPAASITPSIRC